MSLLGWAHNVLCRSRPGSNQSSEWPVTGQLGHTVWRRRTLILGGLATQGRRPFSKSGTWVLSPHSRGRLDGEMLYTKGWRELYVITYNNLIRVCPKFQWNGVYGLNVFHFGKFLSVHVSLRSMDVAKNKLISLHKNMTPTKARFDRCVKCCHAQVCNVPTLQGSHLQTRALGANFGGCHSFCTKPMCPKTEHGSRRIEPLSKTIHKTFFLPEPNLKQLRCEQFGVSNVRVLLLEKS